jgi:hypothetical protein
VEEMPTIVYKCVIVKGQVRESIAEGGRSETNIMVENRKMVTEEGQDKH